MDSDRAPAECRPLICLVSDRHRLSPAASTVRQLDDLVGLVAAAAAAGVDIVQVRERDLPGRTLTDLVGRCVHAADGSPTRVVVNDRVDVALAAGTAGVHLREDSVAAGRARALGRRGWLVTRAIHDATEISEQLAGVDLAVFGSVFPTVSKPAGHGVAGLSALGAAAREAAVPVLAIGGVSEERLEAVWRAGAAGVAGIGLFIDAARSGHEWAVGLGRLVDRVRQSFDTLQPLV
ncbi:MAG TPA: thiamine phosphate synthase [Acidobacteria bacterium]|nr:thiamine phosphate synthase [Acidobacteriota bacterium]